MPAPGVPSIVERRRVAEVRPQPLRDVGEAEALAGRIERARGRVADARIAHRDAQRGVPVGLLIGERGAHLDLAAGGQRRDAVLHRVLDQRLQQQRRDQHLVQRGVDDDADAEALLEARLLDLEVGLDQRDLVAEARELRACCAAARRAAGW